jgi:uncharacterized protein DUF1761
MSKRRAQLRRPGDGARWAPQAERRNPPCLICPSSRSRIPGALLLGTALWVAFPAVLLAGSVMWENAPASRAVIHAGDWLLKLVAIALIVVAW